MRLEKAPASLIVMFHFSASVITRLTEAGTAAPLHAWCLCVSVDPWRKTFGVILWLCACACAVVYNVSVCLLFFCNVCVGEFVSM